MADSTNAPAGSQRLASAGANTTGQASAVGTTAFRLAHAVLLLCTLLALAYLAFGHQTPLPAPADWARFVPAGYELVNKGQDKAELARDLSHGDLVRFDAVPREPGMNPFSMSLVAVRTRKNADLALTYLNEHISAVALEGVGKEQPGGGEATKATKVVMGTLAGKRALQTCINPAGLAGTTAGDLNADIGGARDLGLQARWLQLLGVQPPAAWECALLTIEVAPGANADQDLMAAWEDVYAAWRASPPWPVSEPPQPN